MKIRDMNRNTFFIALLLLLMSVPMTGQTQAGDELKISLKEAQDYALSYNKSIKSAKYDLESAKLGVWELTSALLPNVSASGGIIDNLKLRTFLMPGTFFGDTSGRYYPVRFGTQYNTNAGITANLILFNAPVYVGIQTTKLASKMAEMNVKKTEIDIVESVANAYYLILVSEESLRIIDENIKVLNELLRSTKAMLSVGMAESTDVDQMQSNVTMMENTRSSMERTIEVNYNLLRLLLGVQAETKITLSQTLKSITADINVETLFSREFDYKKNIGYQLLESQEKMSALALKSKKASVLPVLAGYYSYSKEGQGEEIFHQQYFPTSMLGLQISIPLFASGERYTAIKRAKIDLLKASNTKNMLTDQLLLQEKQLKYNLISANLQYKSQKENIEVARRVYTSTENKFRQGMASSLDLTQANSLYLQAENSYISALMNLLQTKVALDKLMNN
jgi:outer membrane protein TolC